jgi:hypothetical protein
MAVVMEEIILLHHRKAQVDVVAVDTLQLIRVQQDVVPVNTLHLIRVQQVLGVVAEV